ncbi:hypothetical protein HID58_092541 [Brassica napus]|uniref:Replication protein A 70 kDa DNA-binding subunit B/D first OB fold domain-containing protein n=2 Tax=Brassica napus TaxID=3708 RepID=A0ABQ7WW91_BRANA|nr:hypothetical protein HID58_092541 [Brassica napus]
MSKNKSISLLKAIKPYKQGWCIQVKLIHSWRQKTNYGGDTLELIFADETVRYINIYLSIYVSHMNYIQRTQRKLSLGEWRLIETFSVSQAGGQYRPTNHTYKMSIIEDTSISPSSYECDDNFLRFSIFEEIGNGTLKTSFLIDDVQVTNAFDASLIQLDPELPETLALKLRVSNNEFALALTDTKKEKRLTKNQTVHWNNVDIKSISEIMMATVVLCKLHMVVKDDTSTCKLIMLDSVGKLIVGCEAEELWDGSYDEIEYPTDLPQPIQDLVGKSLCFGITLGSENVANGSDVFLVSQVCSGDKILQIESNSEPITNVIDGSSIMSGREVKI